MPKKERIPAPGGKKDPYTNFWKRNQWRSRLLSKQLEVVGRNLSGPGAQVLCHALMKNDKVNHLILTHNRIGDAGCAEVAYLLRTNTTIRLLDLAVNDITDVGGMSIGYALTYNHTLQSLSLLGNFLGDDAAAVLALALQQNRELKSLILSYNGITGVGAAAIATALAVNSGFRIDLSQNPIGDDGFGAIAAAFAIAPPPPEPLRPLPTMAGQPPPPPPPPPNSTLSFHMCDIGPRGFDAAREWLSTTTLVRTLNLGSNAAHAVGFCALMNALSRDGSSIETLSLSANIIPDTPEVAEAFQKFLRTNTSVRHLDLSRNALGDRFIRAFADVYAKEAPPESQLSTLNLGINAITDVGARALADVVPNLKAPLTSLVCSKNALTDAGRSALSEAAAANPFRFRLDYGPIEVAVVQRIAMESNSTAGALDALQEMGSTQHDLEAYESERFAGTFAEITGARATSRR